jgi:hypothetical protein
LEHETLCSIKQKVAMKALCTIELSFSIEIGTARGKRGMLTGLYFLLPLLNMAFIHHIEICCVQAKLAHDLLGDPRIDRDRWLSGSLT